MQATTKAGGESRRLVTPPPEWAAPHRLRLARVGKGAMAAAAASSSPCPLLSQWRPRTYPEFVMRHPPLEGDACLGGH